MGVVGVVSGGLSWMGFGHQGETRSQDQQHYHLHHHLYILHLLYIEAGVDGDGVLTNGRENGDGCKDNIGADGGKMDPNL